MALGELKGVDLTNDAAVEVAIKEATKNGKNPTDIKMAKSAISMYKEAMKNAPKEQK